MARGSWGPVPCPPSRPPRWLAAGSILLAAVIWSSSYAVTKVTLTQIPPLTIGALRFVMAAGLLGAPVRGSRERVVLSGRQKARIGAAGLLGITAYFTLENLGVDLASASDATLIVAAYPVFTLVIELVSGRAPFSPVRLLEMVLAIVGVWVVVSAGATSGGGHHLAGDLLLLGGGVAWAAFNVAAREDGGAPVVVVTYYQTLAGAAGFVVLSLLEAGRWAVPAGPNVLRLLYLAVLCSIVGFLAYNYGLRTLDASTAVNILNVVPVLGLLWAMVLAGESPTFRQVVGGGVVILGVGLGLFEAGG